MTQHTSNTAPCAVSFAAMLAASQAAGSSVDLEAHVKRADLSPKDQPVVNLPPFDACASCPNLNRRRSVVLEQPASDIFDDLVCGGEAGCDTPYVAPPRILYGVDLATGPHEAVPPSFEQLARVRDPSVLTDALLLNRILPSCACANALFAAADHELWHGFKLNALKQVADQKAGREKPAIRPDQRGRQNEGRPACVDPAERIKRDG